MRRLDALHLPCPRRPVPQFIWDFKCFSGIDHIENPTEDGIFKIVNDYTGEGWNDQVDDELGNFDYLMGENIDFRNHAVTEESNTGRAG
jgi:alpha-amylase